jgi:membrane associated rhomboid family serine protease
MVALNTVVWLCTLGADVDSLERYMLPKGEGITPLQCITSNFIHEDFFHLLGNMFVVWAFGLIVEGKVGWWRFLLIYLGVGFFECAIEQAIQWKAVDEGVSFGASSIAYGLIAISLIWAPRNDVSVFYFYWIFVFAGAGVKEVPILLFAWLSFAFSLLVAWLTGFAMDSEMFHLLGALVGLIFGVGMLKLNLVDCENWDFFAVLQKREGKKPIKSGGRRSKKKSTPSDSNGFIEPKAERGASSGRAVAALRDALEKRNIDLALDEYARAVRRDGPPQEESLALMNSLLERGRWEDALVVMADYLREHTVKQTYVRLRLAETLILKLQRPKQGLQVLSKLEGVELSPTNQAARDKLIARAEAIAEDAPLELKLEDW